MIKTASINAGATEQVVFDRIYPYFYIKNLSDSDVYAAIDKMSFSAGDDDVTCVPAQSCCIVYSTFASDTVNIKSDSDTAVIVEVIAAYDNNINFFKKNSSKGGGTYDDTAIKSDISNLQTGKADKSDVYTKAETNTALNTKVDVVSGKGLSTNDYTTDDKNKLDSLENYDDTSIKNNIALNLSSIGMSKKNLLKIVGINKITDDYSIIKNSDGSVTVNGTFNTNISVTLGTLKTKNGVKYILSGCPQGGSSSSYRLNMRHEGQATNVYPDIGKGVTFTGIDETMSAIVLIYSGTTVDNLTFYPMIRYADITDDTYEPYQDDLQTQINAILARLDSAGI